MTPHSSDVSRRDFLKAGATRLLGLTLTGTAVLTAIARPPVASSSASPGNSLTDAGLLKKLPPLSFSTLGCPDWTFPAIMDFAVKNGYTGIEVRGIQRQMDLTKCPEFSTPANITTTLQQMKDHGLKFVDLGSSAELHHADPATRQKQMDEAHRFIDLAQQLHCPYVRVFPNKLPKDQDKQATIDLITKGLKELGEYARSSGVTVLMETHGDLVETALLEQIMRDAGGRNTGLIWDIYNMWSITHEPPAQVYPRLKKYIRHTHIKDGKSTGGHEENGKIVDGKVEYLFLGQGESPIFEAIGLLNQGGYKGYYSFEWEKLWHPEIAAPELALADYPKKMKDFFEKL
ncbi:MAG TPA: sugar phosphate isomerase/epimerase family protein [Puia sp.]|nr:sugar phosphate isomerase/epimerase family protein [Puia sp.]